jgi:hypothetical protein
MFITEVAENVISGVGVGRLNEPKLAVLLGTIIALLSADSRIRLAFLFVLSSGKYLDLRIMKQA